VFVGTIDDRFDVPAGVRLVAQATAAMLIVYGAGIEVVSLEHAFFFEVGLGPFSGLFSLLFIIVLINAFNVVDGLDGLAGGLSLTALISLALVGIGCNIWSLALIAAAAVAGFLLFNLPLEIVRPLRSFMGDAGSTSLGLIVASVGMAISQNPMCDVAPVVGLYLVAIPVFDLFSSAIRRVMAGRSPFAPDHEHLHHALVTHGLSQPATLLVMMFGAVLFAGIGLVAHFAEVEDGVLLLGWFAGLALYYQAMRRPAWVVRHLERFRATGARRTRSS
jgi:UDP-GlcNAc:undecaprenyl-phosphate GlcNAc-1-phosphate transferase